MASSFEKAVKGGTKIKLAPPKPKYVEHILLATHSGEAGVAEVFRTLEYRIRDSTWTIVFKALIIVHVMVREGQPNVTLKHVAESPRKLAISSFSDVQEQGQNIRRYADYLLERARSYRNCKIDFVRSGDGHLKSLSVEKGLLRETESVQAQIRALLRCDFFATEPENEITIAAFRMLISDLLALYGVMNEGTINVLEHYFEMSKVDAERALGIYKTFSRQTDQVVGFLGMARQYESATRIVIPKLKHAPTGLTTALEEYLNDPDFEINRRQYVAQQEAKKTGKVKKPLDKPVPIGKTVPDTKAPPPARSEPKKPEKDLIDFFASIEDVGQHQQTMAQQPPQTYASNPPQQFQQPAGIFQSQSNFQMPQITSTQQYGNPFGQTNGDMFGQQPQQLQHPTQQQFQQPQHLQPAFTGAGFGGYTPQLQQQSYGFQPTLTSIPQDGIGPFATSPTGEQQHSTNPFRHSAMPGAASPAQSGFPSSPVSLQRQGTNPFARSPQMHDPNQASSNPPFSSPPPPQQPQASQPIVAQRTGTNPFARSAPSTPSMQSTPTTQLLPNQTGSTNPFRQSQFVNQQTGQGWQANQGTMGGLEQLQTTPIFPRPGQPQ